MSTRCIQHTWKRDLGPFAELYARIVAKVEEATDADLVALIAAEGKRSETNCWWATYAVAPIVADLARKERSRRAWNAATAPTPSPQETTP